MRRDPLDYLSRELDTLKEQGLYRHLRVLEGEQSHKSTSGSNSSGSKSSGKEGGSGTRGGSSEQHKKAGEQSHKNS